MQILGIKNVYSASRTTPKSGNFVCLKQPLLNDIVSFRGRNESIDEITKSEENFDNFIEQIFKNPRIAKIKTKNIIAQEKISSDFFEKYFKKDGYSERYKNKIKKVVEEAKTPEELLKISPNWFPWVFREKFGDGYTFGEVPSEFGQKEDYRKLVTNLLANEKIEGVKELQGGESGKRTFLIKKNDKKYVLKVQNDYTIYSDKLNKALKEDSWLDDTFMRNYKDNEDMKSDSSYLNAMIDFYLNLNDCKNATKIYFYDSKTSSVLYEFLEGEKFEGDLNILNAEEKLSDIASLGIQYNDISEGNIRVKNGELKIIDVGESSFNDILRPTVPGFQFELPNWSGNSLNALKIGFFDNKFRK